MSGAHQAPQAHFTELLRLFERQRELLDDFFESMDIRQAQSMLRSMLDCKGVIFFSGVGKSGTVAQKIATTLTSVGTKALHLCPTNSLHGDMGMLGADDLVVMLSKSGESDELLRMLPFIRAKGAKVIAVVCRAKSRLAMQADEMVTLPLKSELCPFDLAPTTSAALQLIFGDILTVAMMKAKGFELDEYAQNHPAGRIGKRISLKVQDLMITGEHLPCCGPEERLLHTLHDFTAKGCGCLLVVDEAQGLLGIFTDGDLRRTLQSRGATVLNQTMSSLMTRAPRVTEEEALAWDAMQLMERDPNHPVYLLPVVNDGQLKGLIRMHDIIQAGL
jgi:arabinose-5-phosphate isomerase